MSKQLGSTLKAAVLSGKEFIPNDITPIITKPLGLMHKMARKSIKQKKPNKIEKKTPLLISCKNKTLNMHVDAHFSKFDTVPLASKEWKKKKTAGDHFVIHRFGENPATTDKDADFTCFNFSTSLLSALENNKFKHPTNIQTAAIPPICEGKNVMVAAETGNGKTLAYLTPLIDTLLKNRGTTLPPNSPRVLVLTPSTDLALQIHDVCHKLLKDTDLVCKVLIGGKGTKKRQLHSDLSTVHIQIASLGVLSKYVTNGILKLHHLSHCVLDEADTLLDNSFQEKLSHVMKRIPMREECNPLSGAQIIMVGATMPKEFEDNLQGILKMEDFSKVSTDHLHSFMHHVTQRFYRLNQVQKESKIIDLALISKKRNQPTIVFCKTGDTVMWLGKTLEEADIGSAYISGLIEPRMRNEIFKTFLTGEKNLLVCTDMVSRGIDTITAQHIINYDFPFYMADYIHRCGRVGRVGSKDGLITNFVRKEIEVELLHQIEYAVRRDLKLPSVDNDITQIIKDMKLDKEERKKQKQLDEKMKQQLKEILSE